MGESYVSASTRPQAADRAPAFEPTRYEDLDLNRLIVFTLGWLRNERLPPSFENVSVAAFRLFPSKFSLRGFDHPDSNRANRALLQLGPKYRNWAVGSPSTGYNLTPLGEKVLIEARQLVAGGSAERSPKRRGSPGYTWDPASELNDLKATDSYQRFRDGGIGRLKIDDVWHSLGAFRYTPKEAIRERFVALKSIAIGAGDSDALAFLDALRERFETKQT